MVKMFHAGSVSNIQVDKNDYPVKDGVVDVPEHLVPVAKSHGFTLEAPKKPEPPKPPPKKAVDLSDFSKEALAEKIAALSRGDLVDYCEANNVDVGSGRPTTETLKAAVYKFETERR